MYQDCEGLVKMQNLGPHHSVFDSEILGVAQDYISKFTGDGDVAGLGSTM